MHKVRFLTLEPLLLSLSSTDTVDDLLGAIAKHAEYSKAAGFEMPPRVVPMCLRMIEPFRSHCLCPGALALVTTGPVLPGQDGIALVQHDSSPIDTGPWHRREALGEQFHDTETLHVLTAVKRPPAVTEALTRCYEANGAYVNMSFDEADAVVQHLETVFGSELNDTEWSEVLTSILDCNSGRELNLFETDGATHPPAVLNPRAGVWLRRLDLQAFKVIQALLGGHVVNIWAVPDHLWRHREFHEIILRDALVVDYISNEVPGLLGEVFQSPDDLRFLWRGAQFKIR